MLTWAVAWMCTHANHVVGVDILFLFTIIGDVAIAFFVACAVRGWPSERKGG